VFAGILFSRERNGGRRPRASKMRGAAIDHEAFNSAIRQNNVLANITNSSIGQAIPSPKSGTASQHRIYDEEGSATNLVQGIVRVNPIIIFMRRIDEFDGTSFDTKMREMLDATGAPYKAVDVSKDPTMHLAFPEDGSEIALPVLYAHGQKIGTFTEVDQLFRSGTLKGALEKPL